MQNQDVYCGKCGASNTYGMQYCRKCGAVLDYTRQGQYPANPYVAAPPAAPPKAEGWTRWLPWILGGLIAGLGCLIVTVVAIYLLDPFGMFSATATQTATPTATMMISATQQPQPSETPQPSATSELPTATEYPTYTPYPTYTVETKAPSATSSATQESFDFLNAAVSAGLVRYGGCAPSDVEFSVEVTSSENVTAIVLFTRLKDPATQQYLTPWSSGVSMKYKGNNLYQVTQTGNVLSQGADPGTAVVVYQFVNQTKQDEYIHSQNYQDLALEKCP